MVEVTRTDAEYNARRLKRLAGQSADQDALLVEMVFHDRYVQFDISAMELQHVPIEELWRRHIAPALTAVHVPPQVVADPEPAVEYTMP